MHATVHENEHVNVRKRGDHSPIVWGAYADLEKDWGYAHNSA